MIQQVKMKRKDQVVKGPKILKIDMVNVKGRMRNKELAIVCSIYSLVAPCSNFTSEDHRPSFSAKYCVGYFY